MSLEGERMEGRGKDGALVMELLLLRGDEAAKTAKAVEIWKRQGWGDTYGFCFGEDASVAVAALEASFNIRSAEGIETGGTGQEQEEKVHDGDAIRAAGDAVCRNDYLLRAHLCDVEELDFYTSYFMHGDSSRLPPSSFCPATAHVGNGGTFSSCSPGFFGLRDGGMSPQNSSFAACCPGFFCPQNLTCMLPCPVGSFCPRAVPAKLFGGFKLNTRFEEVDERNSFERRYCAPYGYDAMRIDGTAEQHVCGGADNWTREPRDLNWQVNDMPATRVDDFGWLVQATFSTSGDDHCAAHLASMGSIYCPGGWYCPDASTAVRCPAGSRCDPGVPAPTPCGALDRCPRCSSSTSTLALSTIVAAAITLALLASCAFLSRAIVRSRLRRWMRSILKSLVYIVTTVVCSTARPSFSTERRYISMQNESESENSDDNHARSLDDDLEMTAVLSRFAEKDSSASASTTADDGSRSLNSVSSVTAPKLVSHRVTISFTNLSVTVSGGKRILHSVTGTMHPERMTAIMGGSGSGKSTLIEILLNRGIASHARVKGSIYVRATRRPGSPTSSAKLPSAAHSLSPFRRIVGYVPQDDVLYTDLTVRDNLYVSARYRQNLSRDERRIRIDSLLSLLNLKDVGDSVIGEAGRRGISGGQRRRTSIALELVANPSVIFADEPTSGLDSSASRMVVRILKELAQSGMTVVAVIHQPSSSCFLAFDDLILLQQKGTLSYAGPRARAVDYFESSLGFTSLMRFNVADVLIDISEGYFEPYSRRAVATATTAGGDDEINDNGDFALDLEAEWNRCRDEYALPVDESDTISDDGDSVDDGGNVHGLDPKEDTAVVAVRVRQSRRPPGSVTHFIVCLRRELMQAKQRPLSILISCIIVTLSGTAMGLVGGTDTPIDNGVSEYMHIMLSLLAVIFGETVFTRDRLMFQREAASGLSKSAYFLSKLLVDLVAASSFSIIYFSLFYSIAHPNGSFVGQYVLQMLSFFAMSGFGMVVGLALGGKQFSSGAITAVVLVLTWILVTVHLMFKYGYLITKPAMVNAFFAASPTFHFFRGSHALQAIDIFGVWIPMRCGVLNRFGFSVSAFPSASLALFAIGVTFRVLAFLGLLFVHSSHRRRVAQ